ncbi:MAG: calcineurin-like phosphoesterase family protein [Bacteroidota bacterium]
MKHQSMSDGITRRRFIRGMGGVAIGAVIADRLMADPYSPLPFEVMTRRGIRVRGAVRAGGRGLSGVAVSDGISVVRSGTDGAFELVTDSSRPYIFLSLPSGYEIPTGPAGTASLYKPLRPNKANEMDTVWDLAPLPVPDRSHAFLLLADPQTRDTDDVNLLHSQTVPDLQSTLKTLGSLPVFGVGCGDIMYDRLEHFPRYEEAVNRMRIPCFQVLGNHDVEVLSKTDEASAATFMRYFGPTYYSFERGEIHYVVMDDVFWFGDGYVGYIDQRQLDWLKADLAHIERGRTVILFMHIPSFSTQHIRDGKEKPGRSVVVVNRELLNRILEPYESHVIAGHMHETEHPVDHGVRIHVCGAVCGAWWTGPICGDGTPNGYGVFEVNGEEVTWRYKSTGLPVGEQLRVYPPGSDRTAPDLLIANVWDAGPRWKVILYENGDRRGEMKSRRGQDPLSVRLHKGAALPQKHPWVEPYTTDHLFAAPVSPDAREIVVEATDAEERVYRGSPTRGW